MHSVSSHRTIYEYQEVEQEDSFQSSSEGSSIDETTQQQIVDIREIRKSAYEKANALKSGKVEIFPEKPIPPTLQNRVSRIEKIEEDEQVFADAQLQADASEASQSEYNESEASEVIEDLDSRQASLIVRLKQDRKEIISKLQSRDQEILQLRQELNTIGDIHNMAITRMRRQVTEEADRTYFQAAQDRTTEVKWYSRNKKWSIAGFTISNAALFVAVTVLILIIVLV